MEQLSGIDASFLNMETPTVHGHIGGLAVFAPDGAVLDLDKLRALVAARIHELDPLRQRLMTVPLGIDRPYWVEDEGFDLDFHVRNIAVPRPGDDVQLAALVARLHSRPLDRRRPLWELYLIEGLAGDRVATYTKIHQACVDGTTGAEVLTMLVDEDVDGRPADREPVPWSPDRMPSPAEMLARGVVSLALQPRTAIRLGRKIASAATQTARRQAPPLARNVTETLERMPGVGRVVAPRTIDDDFLSRPALVAPRVSFNASISAHRRFAFTSVSLADIKQVKHVHAVTVNDVVMAVCAGALRRWLADRHELPTDPLLAMVPVSVRAGGAGTAAPASGGDRISAMIAALPTNEADPVRRLQRAHAAMAIAKEDHAALPADILADLGRFAPPAVAARVARLVARARLSDYAMLPFNLVISNIPGPQSPRYCAGARLVATYPVPVITDGAGLNITLASYDGEVHFGALACRDAIDDLWPLVAAIEDALGELVAAAAATDPKRTQEKP